MSEQQTIIRIEKTDNYSVISNEVARRRDISARAKGVFYYLMTLPDDWKIYKTELRKHFTEGRDAIDKALKELGAAGYLVVTQKKDEKGKFVENEYTVYESVIKSKEPVDGNPFTENPLTGKPFTDNPHVLNTDITLNTDNTNNEDDKQQDNILPSLSSSSKAKKINGYTTEFENIWEVYPRKVNKQGTFRAFLARKKEVDTETLVTSVRNYAEAVDGKEAKYIMHGSTFFGPDKRYEDYLKSAAIQYCPECGATIIDGRCLRCETDI